MDDPDDEQMAFVRVDDRRGLIALRQQRLEQRRDTFLEKRGIRRDAFDILQTLHRHPDLVAELARIQRMFDLDTLMGDYAALTNVDGPMPAMCVRCEAVMPALPSPDMPSGMWMRWANVCQHCIDDELAKPSCPPASGIRSALARARRARLPATLTDDEWASTVATFNDRCAFCGGPWHLVEHLRPIELGGGTVKWNCAPACISCNNLKGAADLASLDKNMFPEARLTALRDFVRKHKEMSTNEDRST